MTRPIIFTFAIACAVTAYAAPQNDTAFTYQGELNENGSPVTDVCDFQFRMYDEPAGGTQVSGINTRTNVNVTEGRFSAELDFDAFAFDNSDRWLRIEVRCPAGSGNYTTLNPRQPITRSPYSIQTRGIFVDENENVGIGTDDPLDELHVAGDNATLRLEDTSTPGGFTLIKDNQPTQLRISKTNPNGQVLFDMSPIPEDGTSNALVRFFRETDTDGIKRVQFLRGNFTTSPSASIGVDGENSYFQIHGGNVGIGTDNPLGGKLQVASPAGGTISAIDASSNNSVFPTIFAQNNANSGSVLWAVGDDDVGLNSGGVIVVGDPNNENIGIDGNEIMARDGGSTAPLSLNIQGGETRMGGDVRMDGEVRMGPHNIHPAFAYGHVAFTGTIESASSNVNGVTLHGDNSFRVGIAGGLSEHDIAVVSCTSASGIATGNVVGSLGQLVVQTYDHADDSSRHLGFQFIIYRP